jgi:hypothetical protein
MGSLFKKKQGRRPSNQSFLAPARDLCTPEKGKRITNAPPKRAITESCNSGFRFVALELCGAWRSPGRGVRQGFSGSVGGTNDGAQHPPPLKQPSIDVCVPGARILLSPGSLIPCPFVAHSGRATRADECLL